MGRGDVSGACTPVGRRCHRLLSDVDGAASMSLGPASRWPAAVAHKRALFCGARPSGGGRPAEDGFPGSPAVSRCPSDNRKLCWCPIRAEPMALPEDFDLEKLKPFGRNKVPRARGRKAGSKNKIPTTVKAAVVEGLARHGSNGQGEG